MLWIEAKQTDQTWFPPREKGLEAPVTQQGHPEQGNYLKSHLEN